MGVMMPSDTVTIKGLTEEAPMMKGRHSFAFLHCLHDTTTTIEDRNSIEDSNGDMVALFPMDFSLVIKSYSFWKKDSRERKM